MKTSIECKKCNLYGLECSGMIDYIEKECKLFVDPFDDLNEKCKTCLMLFDSCEGQLTNTFITNTCWQDTVY